jgi:hypothetical protein
MFAIALKVYARGVNRVFPRHYLGMIYSGEENVPFLMSLRRDRAAAGKVLIQQFNIGHALNGKLTPVREAATAAFACCLIREEVHDPFLNAIILRFHDSKFIVI